MNRRTVARAVMVVWIAALAWLARRQLFPGEATTLTTGAARLSPDTKYFRVDAGILQIGVLTLSWDTLPTGFTIEEFLALDLPAGQSIRRHVSLTEATTSRALTLQMANRRFTTPSGGQEVRVEFPNDSTQRYVVLSGTAGSSGGFSALASGTRPTIAGILPLRLAYGDRLRRGEVISEPVADLERRSTETIRGTVAGDTVFVLPDSVAYDTLTSRWRTVTLDTIHAWRLDLEVGGLPEQWWVDDGGRLVRLETLFGVTLQRAPFDYSHTVTRDSLRISGPTPRRGLAGVGSLVGSGVSLDTTSATMRYALSRTDRAVGVEAVARLAGGSQSVDSTVVTVSRRWPMDPTTPPQGYLAGREPEPRTRLVMDTAFAGATTARDSLIRLTRWIARRVTVDTNTMHHSDPNRMTREWAGTPEAMAGFLVTLARAVGWPARVVTGLAVTPQGLFSHTWAEVWVGDWVPVDPVSGHVPASARLLRVTEGGLGRPFETLWRTAALRVEPLPTGSR